MSLFLALIMGKNFLLLCMPRNLDWIPDTVNFTLWGATYFLIPRTILEPYSGAVKLPENGSVFSSLLLRFVRQNQGLPWVAQWQRFCLQCRSRRRHEFDPWVGKNPWRRAWQPPPVVLPGESRGQKGLVGYSPWGCKELDMIEET